MIRQHMVSATAGEKNFRWRGTEVTRLEGFSDAVFGFAVTLLVVSLEVPKTYNELMASMRGFPAFGICFALLVKVWFDHYHFFRRYGLQDSWCATLNSALLFFVLFYVYPLKFLWFSMFTGSAVADANQGRMLLVIYGAGFAAIFGIFALLYLHAWRRREELELNALEQLKTRHRLIDHLAMAIVGVLSAALALTLPLHLVGLAGWFYFVISLYFFVAGSIFGKKERLLAEKSVR